MLRWAITAPWLLLTSLITNAGSVRAGEPPLTTQLIANVTNAVYITYAG